MEKESAPTMSAQEQYEADLRKRDDERYEQDRLERIRVDDHKRDQEQRIKQMQSLIDEFALKASYDPNIIPIPSESRSRVGALGRIGTYLYNSYPADIERLDKRERELGIDTGSSLIVVWKAIFELLDKGNKK